MLHSSGLKFIRKKYEMSNYFFTPNFVSITVCHNSSHLIKNLNASFLTNPTSVGEENKAFLIECGNLYLVIAF